MKYLKLFEQFDEEEWWNDDSFDIALPKMKIIKIVDAFYLMVEKFDGKLTLFEGLSYTIKKPEVINYNPYVGEEDMIVIYDKYGKYNNMKIEYGPFKHTKYKNLPKEIKKALI